ncbi:unnamed protein product [Rodentolepis nana]|uniref:Uncharacterized protein n=1 Tax=Rodentolepis nana TaxID=102285 RepID=A0A158QHC3_RODNA|nr:unnamed protein product [Rodentolepis nana]
MPTGSTDEAIFGSPDLSEFSCFAEVPTKLPSSIQGQEGSQMWPTSENGTSKPLAEENGARKCSKSSATTPDSTESGDEEDILGLISSSLDRFNALLHHNSQTTSLPIPVNRSEIPVHDIGSAIPTTNFPNSMLSSWSPFAKTQGPPSSLSYSSTNSPVALQQKSMPCPPGLPRLNHQQQQQQQQQPSTTTSGILKSIGLADGLPSTQRKQRSVSQTFSDTDETSSLWETHWKALPSEMAMLSVDSGIDGGDLYLMPNWLPNSNNNNNATNTTSSVSSSSASTGGCAVNGMNECCGAGNAFPPVLNSGNFSPAMDSFPPHSHFQIPTSVASNPQQTFEFPPFDTNLIKQAAVIAAAAAQAANEASKAPQLLQPPNDLRSFLWLTPSWSSTADCSPSTETSQMHFHPGDHHQHLTSRFETTFRQQQQQQSRQLYNRRKADSICFSSAARQNSSLLASASNSTNTNVNNRMKSHIGQLGSPPPTSDLCCQHVSKSYGNTPQKFARVEILQGLLLDGEYNGLLTVSLHTVDIHNEPLLWDSSWD